MHEDSALNRLATAGFLPTRTPAHPAVSRVQAVRSERVVIGGVDGTHMGLAVNWWAEEVATGHPADPDHDPDGIVAGIAAVTSGAEALRSAIEVLLFLAEWASRMNRDFPDDGGIGLFGHLGDSPFLTSPQRALCRDLGAGLAADRMRNSFTVPPLPVDAAMNLVRLLSGLIDHRFGISTTAQIATLRSVILGAESESSWLPSAPPPR